MLTSATGGFDAELSCGFVDIASPRKDLVFNQCHLGNSCPTGAFVRQRASATSFADYLESGSSLIINQSSLEESGKKQIRLEKVLPN
jgi:hypothetical protein